MALQNSQDRFNGVVASLAIKAPCKTVSDAGNILLEGEQTLSGIPVVAGDRVLVIAQTDPIENGIWCVDTSEWQRTADFDGNRDVAKGTLVTVNRPTNNLTTYVQINLGVSQDEPVIGTDPLAFNIFFSQNNSIDDLSDVDLTGCSDDDIMYWSGGVLICSLGALTYDGNELLSDGNIGIKGFSSKGPILRAVESTNAVPTLNPKANEPFTGWGGNAAGELTGILEDGGAGLRALLMSLPAAGHTRRRWNRETITASTTQTQGNGQLTSSIAIVNVVANEDDTVTLIDSPQSALDHLVMNQGAERLQIFPSAGHDLGLGTDVPTTIFPGGAIWFVGVNTTTWAALSVSVGATGGGALGALRGAKAYKTAAFRVVRNDIPDIGQAIPGPGDGSATGNAEQIIAWNAAVYDTDNIHDPVTNNTRFTIPPGITAVEMMIGCRFDDETSTPQTGGLHIRLRKNGVINGAVDSIFVVAHNNTDPGWIPWNFDALGAATQEVGGNESGQAGSQQWYSGTIFVDPADYLEVAFLTQAGTRDIPLNGCWAEMRLLQ